ncbi:hypothetical protein BROUX41_003486 [Berkeleyomyces rouxiae]|uniref:uncharacterized protein n=1 Tax=Berkeleyomyces rouxiae TaxID=2035830 RepID=UPI003B7919F5
MASRPPVNGARATTPSFSQSEMVVRTPPTPRFGGYEDRWEPYSPRKSARIAERKVHRTPSPPPFTRSKADLSSHKHSSSKIAPIPFPSLASPRKRISHGQRTPRKTSSGASLTLDPACFSSSSKSKQASSSSTSAHFGSAGMPTPAKTPRRIAPRSHNVDSVSRNLFSTSTTTTAGLGSPELTPRRRRVKKYTGSSLDKIIADEPEEEPAIDIFTDIQDRPFVVNNTEEDPFLRKAPHAMAPPEPRRRSQRKNVLVAGEGKITVDDAIKRGDGIIFTFRGKKFLRKLAPETDGKDGIRTRTGLKPRLLFPPKKSQSAPPQTIEDEEADTDVEDHIKNEIIIAEDEEEHVSISALQVPATPTKPIAAGGAKTPKSAGFNLMTPPESDRITRSSGRFFDAMPIKQSSAVFQEWRTKGAKRRRADDSDSEPAMKRARA